MRHFVIKAKNQDERKVWRELIIPADAKLSDLAELVVSSFGLDLDHCYGFYDNIKKIYDSKICYEEFVDLGQEHEDNAYSVEDNPVSKLWPSAKEQDKKWVLLFDYGDEWLFELELTKIKNLDTEQKTLLRSKGADYDQYGYDEDGEDMGEGCVCPDCLNEDVERGLGINQYGNSTTKTGVIVTLYIRHNGKYLLGNQGSEGWHFMLVGSSDKNRGTMEESVKNFLKNTAGISDFSDLVGLNPYAVNFDNKDNSRAIVAPYYLECPSLPSNLKPGKGSEYKKLKLFTIEEIVEGLKLMQFLEPIRQINGIDDEKEFGELRGKF